MWFVFLKMFYLLGGAWMFLVITATTGFTIHFVGSLIQTKLKKVFATHLLLCILYYLNLDDACDNIPHWAEAIFHIGCVLTLLMAHLYLLDSIRPLFSRQLVLKLSGSPTYSCDCGCCWVFLFIPTSTLLLFSTIKDRWVDSAVLCFMASYFLILGLLILVKETVSRSAYPPSSPSISESAAELGLGEKTEAWLKKFSERDDSLAKDAVAEGENGGRGKQDLDDSPL